MRNHNELYTTLTEEILSYKKEYRNLIGSFL